MIRKLMEFQTIIQNYNAKSSIEPEIFGIFQHKVEQTPHFARVSEVRHIIKCFSNTESDSNLLLSFSLFFGYEQTNPEGGLSIIWICKISLI